MRPSETGGLKSNLSGSFPSKMCFGIIHAAFQRTVNSEWKREFGFFSLKTTVYLSGASMLSTLSWILRAAHQAVGVEVGLGGEHHVVGGELDAVAPVDAGPQLHGHLGEVVVVDRRLGGERIVPDAVEAVVGVDVPEGVHRELVQAGRLAAGVDRPDVEPAGVLDRPFRVLDDQGFVARHVGRALREARVPPPSARWWRTQVIAKSASVFLPWMRRLASPSFFCELAVAGL